MLLKDALKVIAACEIYENDMPKLAKMQLIRFIEVASEEQLRHYLIREDIIQGEEILTEGVLKIAILVGVGYAIGRAISNQAMDQAAKSCKTSVGPAKQLCIKGYKRRALQGQIGALKKEMSKCNQTADAEKCKKTFAKHIQKAEKKMGNMM